MPFSHPILHFFLLLRAQLFPRVFRSRLSPLRYFRPCPVFSSSRSVFLSPSSQTMLPRVPPLPPLSSLQRQVFVSVVSLLRISLCVLHFLRFSTRLPLSPSLLFSYLSVMMSPFRPFIYVLHFPCPMGLLASCPCLGFHNFWISVHLSLLCINFSPLSLPLLFSLVTPTID